MNRRNFLGGILGSPAIMYAAPKEQTKAKIEMEAHYSDRTPFFSFGVEKPELLADTVSNIISSYTNRDEVQAGKIIVEFIKSEGPNPIYPGCTSSFMITMFPENE